MGRRDRDRFGANTRKGFNVEVLSCWGPAQPLPMWYYDVEMSTKAVMVPKSFSELALPLPAYLVSPPRLLGCSTKPSISWPFFSAIDPTSHLNPATLDSRDTHTLGERQSSCHPESHETPMGPTSRPVSYQQRQKNVSPTMKGTVWAHSMLPIKQKRPNDL